MKQRRLSVVTKEYDPQLKTSHIRQSPSFKAKERETAVRVILIPIFQLMSDQLTK